MDKNFLLDEWSKTGDSFESFQEAVEELAASTDFIRVNSKGLSVLSYAEKNEEGKLVFFSFNPIDVHNSNFIMRNHTASVNPKSILMRGDFEDLIKELTSEVGVLFFNGVSCLFVSKKVLTSRLQPFGVNGDFLSEMTHERDLLIAKLFGSKALFRTLVTRKQNGITKVFSIMGENYKDLSQDILLKLYDELTQNGAMGETSCRRWELTHFTTSIFVEFPEKAEEFQALYDLPEKVIPGIVMETSDTGDSAVRIKGTWRVKNSLSVHGEVSKKHAGEITTQKLLDEASKEIFSEYTKLPAALCDLMASNISDPDWKLETARGQSRNRNAIERVLKHAFKKLKIVEAIGKKAEAAIARQMLLEFDYSMPCTAYDIAMSIMTMPERIEGLSARAQEKLEKAVSKAPYVDYEIKTEEPELPSLTA